MIAILMPILLQNKLSQIYDVRVFRVCLFVRLVVVVFHTILLYIF
jgi:hypothetical protein